MSAATSTCFICNASCVSERNSVQIFADESKTCLERPLPQLLNELLPKEVAESSTHSQHVCKKCFKQLDEVEELNHRLDALKSQLMQNYETTVGTSETPEIKPKEEANKENEMPKKILDIPSSSDDDTGHEAMPKKTLHTIEDIEMELEKIHGGLPEEEVDEEAANKVHELDVQNFTTIMEGDGGNSTDSEYDPTDALMDKKSIALEGVQIKIETTNDEAKPNILKKKILPSGEIELKKVDMVMEYPMVARDGNLYTCLLCQGDETVAGEAKAIIVHMKQDHNTRLYICDVCGADFKKRNELSAHVDEHVATEEGDFQCEVCNRIFSNLRLFRIHRRMHYPQNKAWACDTCGKRYSSKNLLDEHVNTHTGVRPYICKMCGKDFASKYTYKAHEKTHEVRPRPFTCMHCPKTFLSQQNLTQHERTHLGMKEFACHLCGKQFGSAHNLEVHSIVHTGYKPFVCGLCGKSFARKAEIRDHERTHTGERPYQCEFCGATFSQRSNLQSHKRATHYDDKRYRCEDCGKGFKRRRLLDYHMKAQHTGERPFKCEICDATFVYPEHFKKHRRIHTGEKPFLCEVCGKAFNSRDNRNAHRFVHSDKKPYECLGCGAGFMRKPLLYQHMQAAGHLNDTIVVNQPRVTTDDDRLVTLNEDGEMELAEDSKLYIADRDGNEHIIIDGQQISFGDDADGEIVDEIEQVVGQEEEYEEIITSEALAGTETQIIQTPDGPVQLVKVRIPNDDGEEEEAWIKIVPE